MLWVPNAVIAIASLASQTTQLNDDAQTIGLAIGLILSVPPCALFAAATAGVHYAIWSFRDWCITNAQVAASFRNGSE